MDGYLTRAEAVQRIYSSGNLVFGCSFVKRSDGSLRSGAFRLGVKSHLRGGERAYDAHAHGLITVFSMNDNGYRSFGIEGIVSVTFNGETFIISDSPDNPV